jgi:hypothetical protein
MSLVNVTPSVNWDLDCGFNDCDGYGCEIHDSYSRLSCDVDGCDSTVSTYLVNVNDVEMSICQYHYATLKAGN